MGRFRKKPVEIEAQQWSGSAAEATRLIYWIRDAGGVGRARAEQMVISGIEIDTLEGTMVAGPGDWIIRGVAGEFYPCKPEIFVATYDPVAP